MPKPETFRIPASTTDAPGIHRMNMDWMDFMVLYDHGQKEMEILCPMASNILSLNA